MGGNAKQPSLGVPPIVSSVRKGMGCPDPGQSCALTRPRRPARRRWIHPSARCAGGRCHIRGRARPTSAPRPPRLRGHRANGSRRQGGSWAPRSQNPNGQSTRWHWPWPPCRPGFLRAHTTAWAARRSRGRRRGQWVRKRQACGAPAGPSDHRHAGACHRCAAWPALALPVPAPGTG
jgi:hypothetical protein